MDTDREPYLRQDVRVDYEQYVRELLRDEGAVVPQLPSRLEEHSVGAVDVEVV